MTRVDINELTAVIADLIARYPELADDHELLHDTITGETDVDQIVDRLLAVEADAAALSAALAEQVKAMTARRKRFDRRQEAARDLLLLLLRRTGLRKLELPSATLSLRKGSTSVVIADEDAVPRQLCETVYRPDKAAIRTHLEAGEAVPGAELVVGDDSLAIRRT